MLHLLTVLAAIYGISWIVSTPEARAAARPQVDRWGKIALATALGFLGFLWLLAKIGADPPTDPPPEHQTGPHHPKGPPRMDRPKEVE